MYSDVAIQTYVLVFVAPRRFVCMYSDVAIQTYILVFVAPRSFVCMYSDVAIQTYICNYFKLLHNDPQRIQNTQHINYTQSDFLPSNSFFSTYIVINFCNLV
jgi:hypothetical protein